MVHMGFSPEHTSSIPLLLNPPTGAMTHQFHVVFDDWFATVTSDIESLPDFNTPEWREMFGESVYQCPLDAEDLESVRTQPGDPTPEQLAREQRVRDAMERAYPAGPLEGAALPVPMNAEPAQTMPEPREPSQPMEISDPMEPPTPVELPVHGKVPAPREPSPANSAQVLQRESVTYENSKVRKIANKIYSTDCFLFD